MKALLDGLLPRFYPGLKFMCIPHEGNQDLEKSIPRKLKGFREEGVRFLVIRDNDGGDCGRLKKKLVSLCKAGGRPKTVVRIACQELEAWYLGDPDALAEAFKNESLRKLKAKPRYREPDTVTNPSAEVERHIPEFQKISGARRMAEHLSRERNTSRSFHVFLEAIDRLVETLA